MSIDDDPILSTREAAVLLGVSVATVQSWLERGALPSWKTPGGHRRVRRSAIWAFTSRSAGVVPGSESSMGLRAPATLSLVTESIQTGNPDLTVSSFEAQLEDNPVSGEEYEVGRLQAVQRSGLINNPPETRFDRITWLLSQIVEAPVALMTLLTADRQLVKSGVGVGQELFDLPRAQAFCNYTIQQGTLFCVPDTLLDARFSSNPLVINPPNLRFYAGVPILGANGFRLGALCVLDYVPRQLSAVHIRGLLELGDMVSEELNRHARRA